MKKTIGIVISILLVVGGLYLLVSSLSSIISSTTEKDIDIKFGEYVEDPHYFSDSYEFSVYKLPVTVTNKGKTEASFSIKIEAIDIEGRRIDVETIIVDTLGSGQSQEFEAFVCTTEETVNKLKTAEFKVIEISKVKVFGFLS